MDFGPIALAHVGALAHYEYRAVGETVNNASRFEELNKELGTRLLVSGAVAEGILDFLLRDLGCFTLRGKHSQVRAFELVAHRTEARQRQIELCEGFRGALLDYEAGQISQALRRFRRLRARFPADGPTRLYIRRCESFEARDNAIDVTARLSLLPKQAAVTLRQSAV